MYICNRNSNNVQLLLPLGTKMVIVVINDYKDNGDDIILR